MTDAHCHVSCGEASVREFIVGRDFFGVHPWETLGTENAAALELPALRESLLAKPTAGVGEIGLDRLKRRDIPPLMREVFAAQLALALELRRPVVLHGAKCWGQVVAAVKAATATRGISPPIPGVPFLFHGFSRSDGLIPDIVALGGYISVGPAVLNDHAVNYRALVKKIPLDRLLVETDNVAESESRARIQDVLAQTAALRGLPVSEIEAITDENARKFIDIP